MTKFKGLKVIDRGAKKIRKRYLKLAKQGRIVKMGQPKELVETYPNRDITTAEVGFFHEFGTVMHRERMWLRKASTKAEAKEIFRRTVPELKRLFGGKSTDEELLEVLRFQSEKVVKDSIRKEDLIDTGLLLKTTGAVVGDK